jgi:hypothetical protein
LLHFHSSLCADTYILLSVKLCLFNSDFVVTCHISGTVLGSRGIMTRRCLQPLLFHMAKSRGRSESTSHAENNTASAKVKEAAAVRMRDDINDGHHTNPYLVSLSPRHCYHPIFTVVLWCWHLLLSSFTDEETEAKNIK